MTGILAGRKIVVTGAARGLGRAVAEGFARLDATLFVGDRLPVTGLGNARVYEVDLGDRVACWRFVQSVQADSGGIDVLVNNAAILVRELVEDTKERHWDETLAVNLTAPFVLIQGFLPGMRRKGGSIINVSSRAGVDGFGRQAAYCASKFGIEGLTRAVAAELDGEPISVNTITPGARIKPTMMTVEEEAALEPDAVTWGSADKLFPAFLHLALARGEPTGQRFEADKLSEAIAS